MVSSILRLLKLALWVCLFALAYYNWDAGFVFYGLKHFQLTQALWSLENSLFVGKVLAVFSGIAEGTFAVTFSPSVWLVNWADPSRGAYDLTLGLNIVGYYVATKWNSHPKSDLIKNVNASASNEFQALRKTLEGCVGRDYSCGSLAWLLAELEAAVAQEKRLAIVCLCRLILLLHCHCNGIVVEAASATGGPLPESIVGNRELLPGFKELWYLSDCILEDLFCSDNQSTVGNTTTMLLGTLTVAQDLVENLVASERS